MIITKFNKTQEQILQAQTIGADQPGTILRDFQTLLSIVGAEGLKAAGKYNLPPLDRLDDMNQRLSRPLRLELKRPRLRSNPYLQGLHLLLRASGLSRVTGVGAKTRLVLDAAMLERWNALNPTEQYFTLLEAWLRFGRPEMVGDRGSPFSNFLSDCLLLWHHLPVRGLKDTGDGRGRDYLRGTGRDFYHIALMDLFGLMEVDHPRPAVTPWRPAGVKHTPFGDALLSRLDQWWSAKGMDEWVKNPDADVHSTAGPQFGRWQPLFQPYFREWRNNLLLPQPAPREGVFVFRVSLGKVWRASPSGPTVRWMTSSARSCGPSALTAITSMNSPIGIALGRWAVRTTRSWTRGHGRARSPSGTCRWRSDSP